MNQKINASLVIPLFNNSKTLVSQLKKCDLIMKKLCSQYEIIVCDDKSTDTSALLLKKYFSKFVQFKLYSHKYNQGIAKTIDELYRKARFDYIVLFSVDGDWDPQDIDKMLRLASTNNADIVIGKRNYEDYSVYRKIISFSYNLLSYLFFQVKTIDAGSIKVFKKNLFHSTKLISTSIFFEAEFIIRAAKNGKKILGIPVIFKKQKQSKGLGGKLTLVVSSFRDLLYLRFRM